MLHVRTFSFDGQLLTGFASFSHDFPAPPVILNPRPVDDEERAGEVVVPTTDLLIQWWVVRETVDGRPVRITGYEVIVTNDPHTQYPRPDPN